MKALNNDTEFTADIAHKLLLQDKRTLEVIALEADVGFHWLGKFKQGKYEDPGSRKVEKLYRYLSESA